MSPLEKVDLNAPKFPRFSISGGPHGHEIVPKLNGEVMKGVHRIEITVDVNDVIRVKTFTFAMVDLELEVAEVGSNYIAMVREPAIEGDSIIGYISHVEGRGKTIEEALEDAAATLRATKAAEEAL